MFHYREVHILLKCELSHKNIILYLIKLYIKYNDLNKIHIRVYTRISTHIYTTSSNLLVLKPISIFFLQSYLKKEVGWNLYSILHLD